MPALGHVERLAPLSTGSGSPKLNAMPAELGLLAASAGAKIERGDFAGAAAGMRASLWARQVGDRDERLARMMEKGTV